MLKEYRNGHSNDHAAAVRNTSTNKKNQKTAAQLFGNPDLVKYAESFGCVGMRVNQPDELLPALRKALDTPGMVVVDIPTDYSKNVEIGEHLIPEAWD
jgi:acetolactate synthase-1/2/3 large subunit